MVKKLKLYTVDMKYIRNLAKKDDNVMSVSPQIEKENRPFVGVIVLVNGNEYCVPLGSPKSKFKGKRNKMDFLKIMDSTDKDELGNDKLIGVLNFNNMIPVSDSVLNVIDLYIQKKDSPKTINYKKLLTKQLDWCRKNESKILNNANRIYDIVTKYPDQNKFLVSRCCDFKKLEQVLAKYLANSNSDSLHFGNSKTAKGKASDNDKPPPDVNSDDAYFIRIEDDRQIEALKAAKIPYKINEKHKIAIVYKSDAQTALDCMEKALQSIESTSIHKPRTL